MADELSREKLGLLKKVIPFKWRVQSAIPKNAPTHVQMIAYVDARDVAMHLDAIVGQENWCDRYEEIKGNLFCSIGIHINGQWIFKSDCGTASKTEKEKGESSDAFKRAAVKWGVNRDAYKVGMIKIKCKEYAGQFYPCDDKGVFLKGQDLYNFCNSLAKIDELDNYGLEISDFEGEDWDRLEILFGLKEHLLHGEELIGAKRIITKKESSSYTKLLNKLTEL